MTEEAWQSRDSEGVKMTLLRIYTLKECREKDVVAGRVRVRRVFKERMGVFSRHVCAAE